jgi:hypothetical protein
MFPRTKLPKAELRPFYDGLHASVLIFSNARGKRPIQSPRSSEEEEEIKIQQEMKIEKNKATQMSRARSINDLPKEMFDKLAALRENSRKRRHKQMKP